MRLFNFNRKVEEEERVGGEGGGGGRMVVEEQLTWFRFLVFALRVAVWFGGRWVGGLKYPRSVEGRYKT